MTKPSIKINNVVDFNGKPVEVLGAKSEEYATKKFEVNNILSFPKIRNWLLDESLNNGLILGRFYADNRKELREILGKPSFCYRGEFYFHCWVVDLGKAQLLILTAKDKGTCHEVITHREGKKIRKDLGCIIEFLGNLRDKLDGE